MEMISNRQELLRNGTCITARRLIVGAIEAAFSAADARSSIRESVILKGNTLRIIGKNGRKTYSLKDFHSIHVIGAGKASGHMAEALFQIMGERITDGFVIIPENLKVRQTGRIRLWQAAHPLPDQRGMEGVRKMLASVSDLDRDDLVICLISGGGSALMPLPYGNLTISEKRKVTRGLLLSGATIQEINAVRKHLSAIKGGRLAERLDSTIISLIVSDVVGDRLDSIASGPTVPDNTTFRNAANILKKYGLWSSLKVRKVIEDGIAGIIPETPKPYSSVFKRVRNFIIANNSVACEAAMNYLRSKGVNTKVMTMEGEARNVGMYVADLAYNARKIPSAVVMGGETTVTVRGRGRGGRNQEAVLSACIHNQVEKTAVASVGTDGIDGNSDAAGAIVDYLTIKRAKNLKLDPLKYLRNNDSNTFFRKLSDTIYTGPTGTNVNDLLILLCL
jgi:glycerate-2-kinase